MSSMDLSRIQNAKIACAEKVYNMVSSEDVRFGQVSTYDDLLQVIQGMA